MSPVRIRLPPPACGLPRRRPCQEGMPAGRPLSLFPVGRWQMAVGSGNLRFMIFDLRLRLAVRAFEDLPWRRRPRRRALRGNGLISGRRLADTMARAPSPRVAGGSQSSATAGRRGRVELPLDRKRHGGNGRAGARPSRGDMSPERSEPRMRSQEGRALAVVRVRDGRNLSA